MNGLVNATIEVSHAEAYLREAIDFFLACHTPERILEDANRAARLSLHPAVGLSAPGPCSARRSNGYSCILPPAQGYGALLMRALEREALDRGVGRVDLSASLPSKRFYDVLGVRDGRRGVYSRPERKVARLFRDGKSSGRRPIDRMPGTVEETAGGVPQTTVQ